MAENRPEPALDLKSVGLLEIMVVPKDGIVQISLITKRGKMESYARLDDDLDTLARRIAGMIWSLQSIYEEEKTRE